MLAGLQDAAKCPCTLRSQTPLKPSLTCSMVCDSARALFCCPFFRPCRRRRRTSCVARRSATALRVAPLTSCQVRLRGWGPCGAVSSRQPHPPGSPATALAAPLCAPGPIFTGHSSLPASPAVCPPYELVDYNELYDLLDESPLLHEVRL